MLVTEYLNNKNKKMITYNWKIETLDCEVKEGELENVIKNVHWRYIGISELGTSVDLYGVQLLSSPSVENFIPTNELTNEIVAQWLENSFSALQPKLNVDKEAPIEYEEISKLDNMKKTIEDRIYTIENPTTVNITLNQ